MSAETKSVPLRLRVPKPPHRFVGRRSDLSRLRETVESGNVAIVTGLPGIGKSSLVRAFIHEEPTHESRALYVSFKGPDDAGTAIVELARVVSSAHAGEWVKIPDGTDVDVLIESTLEICERGAYRVVIDDFHHVEETLERVLVAASRHATRSAWIATSRAFPRHPDLKKQTIKLESLGDEDLLTLARAQLPSEDELRLGQIVAASQGSPGALFREVFGPQRDDASSLPWVGASAAARRVAELLAVVEVPLDRGDLEAIVGDAAVGTEELERRGIVALGFGVELTPAVAALVSQDWRTETRAHLPTSTLEALSSSASPPTRLVAIRLALHRGEPDLAHRFAVLSLEALFDAGLARELFDLLAGRVEPSLRELRLIAADASNSDEALAWAATVPRPESIRARLAWASARALMGEAGAALEEARLVSEIARDPLDQSACALLIARVSRLKNAPREGIAALETAPPVDDIAVMARRWALLGVLHALDSNEAAAHVALTRAQQDVARVAEGKRLFVFALIASAHLLLGSLRRCREVLDAARESIPRIRATSWWMKQSALVSLEGGDVESALRWAESTLSSKHHLRRDAMVARQIKLRAHLALGSREASRLALESLFVDADRSEAEGSQWTSVAAAYAAHVLGDATMEGVLPAEGDEGPPARMLRACQAMFQRRRGTQVPASRYGALDRTDKDPIDVRIVELRQRAEEHLLLCEYREAEPYLEEAQRLARLHGWVLLEADVICLRGDLAYLAGGSATAAAIELVRLIDTPRFRAEGELFRLASAKMLDVSAFAALAALDDSPIAARRARAIAYGDVQIDDAVDRAFVEEVRRRSSNQTDQEVPRSTRSIALDEGTKEAVLGGGSLRIDFNRHDQLWRLLVSLVSKESATKEELVRAGWDTDYHPLRDDGRLRVALGRLRKMLNVPGGVTLVSTGQSGYRLVDIPTR